MPTTRIALVCPGGRITPDLAAQTGEIAAARFGAAVSLTFHPQCFLSAGHFAGTDAQRSAAFLEVANDPAYDAVWFARGGYGACRLDEALFARLNDAARGKIYLGYSDAGFLLARLYRLGIGRPVHGPMPSDLTRAGGAEAVVRALDYLAGGAARTLDPSLAEPPAARRKTVAFNMTVLACLLGTDWAPDLSGHAVMLEEVSEYLYAVDRTMFAIAQDGNFRKAAGVMLGRVGDVPENDRPFGETAEEIAMRWCAQAGVPFLGRADIGHDADNKIVPFGAPVSEPRP